MQFNGFSKKGTKFLKDLSQNNTKVWFENHRHIWEDEIRTPTENFVEEMGETLQILVSSINYKAKVGGSLFRIYRDIRFSKDKTPMKTKIGLLFWQGINHRMQSSSFYMHFDENEYFIATGIRNFKPPMLKTFREYIQDNNKREELKNIINKLIEKGYNIPEPKFIRYPKNCNSNDTNSNFYLFGSLYSYKSFKLNKKFYTFDIITQCFNIYNDMLPLQQWVYNMTLTHKNT